MKRKHADLWSVVLFCPNATVEPEWDEWHEYPVKQGGECRVLIPKSGVVRIEVDVRHEGAINFGLSASPEAGAPMIRIANCLNFVRPGDVAAGLMSLVTSTDDNEKGFGVAKNCRASLIRHFHNEIARLPAAWPVKKARKEWL